MPDSHRFPRDATAKRQALQQALQQQLEIYHYPRVIMLGLIVIVALFAFVLSHLLRTLGVIDLAFRYLIVWVLIYLVFIGLLRVWAWWKLSREKSKDGFDISELVPDSSENLSSSTGASDSYTGSGGGFGGGGAKGSWSNSSGGSKNFSPSHSGSSSNSHSYFNSLGDIAEAEALPFIAIIAILVFIMSLFGSLGWMTYSLVETAPVLLAELLADVLIVNGLGRRLRIAPMASPYWFYSIWQRTQKFFWGVVGCLIVVWIILHLSHIQAQTLGELFRLL